MTEVEDPRPLPPGLEQLVHPPVQQRPAGAQQQADHAVLTIDTPAGPYTLEADWLVAADGGRSAIRSQLGLKLEGASFESLFVIADIRIDLPYPTERLAFFDPDWNPGNTILMHREPHGIWRLDYQLPPGETPEEALKPESIKARVDAQLAMIGHAGVPWEMDWCSVYSARALTLPDYVHGRVLFTGDAAHLLPIFGVRGANTGFQDAQALAWRLAFVVQGLAAAPLLAASGRRTGALPAADAGGVGGVVGDVGRRARGDRPAHRRRRPCPHHAPQPAGVQRTFFALENPGGGLGHPRCAGH